MVSHTWILKVSRLKTLNKPQHEKHWAMLEWSYENYFEAYSETVQCMKAAAPNPQAMDRYRLGCEIDDFQGFYC